MPCPWPPLTRSTAVPSGRTLHQAAGPCCAFATSSRDCAPSLAPIHSTSASSRPAARSAAASLRARQHRLAPFEPRALEDARARRLRPPQGNASCRRCCSSVQSATPWPSAASNGALRPRVLRHEPDRVLDDVNRPLGDDAPVVRTERRTAGDRRSSAAARR